MCILSIQMTHWSKSSGLLWTKQITSRTLKVSNFNAKAWYIIMCRTIAIIFHRSSAVTYKLNLWHVYCMQDVLNIFLYSSKIWKPDFVWHLAELSRWTDSSHRCREFLECFLLKNWNNFGNVLYTSLPQIYCYLQIIFAGNSKVGALTCADVLRK